MSPRTYQVNNGPVDSLAAKNRRWREKAAMAAAAQEDTDEWTNDEWDVRNGFYTVFFRDLK